jgi:hypothetical protein
MNGKISNINGKIDLQAVRELSERTQDEEMKADIKRKIKKLNKTIKK